MEVKEILGRPDGLQSRELWEPGKKCGFIVLWSAKNHLRHRVNFLEAVDITEETALINLTLIRSWWDSVKGLWTDGKMFRVIHDGSLPDDEVQMWIDVNLVAPFVQSRAGETKLTPETIKLLVIWEPIQTNPTNLV